MMSTEWKGQCAKCEGDAEFIVRINKRPKVLQSHVDTLAQVQASVNQLFRAPGHDPKGLSPVLSVLSTQVFKPTWTYSARH